MSNVVHFPRHLTRQPSRPLDLCDYIEAVMVHALALELDADLVRDVQREHERISGEHWIALEERVRARHPQFFDMLDAMERDEPRNTRWYSRFLRRKP